MLILARKKNESIIIDDDIKIVVIEIRGEQVRLGVEAPENVPVHRREVFDAIHRAGESNRPSIPASQRQLEEAVEKAATEAFIKTTPEVASNDA